MNRLSLQLLGSPEVRLDGRPVTLRERKAFALLFYLAATAEAHRREFLATFFWPELDSKRGRANLRRSLWLLKQALDDGWVTVDGDALFLNQTDEIWTDVAHFRSLLTQAGRQSSEQASIEAVEEAVALFRGDFLSGFTLPDSPAFDEWQFFEAESFRGDTISALDELVLHYTQEESYHQAINYARRRLALDPLHEPAHQNLMRLFALSGRQAAALRQLDECRRILQDELGVGPDMETEKLAADIRERRLGSADRVLMDPDVASMISNAVAVTNSVETDPTPNVIPPRAIFVGRTRPLGALDAALADVVKGQGRLRIVTGEAGAGKTALITEFLHQTANKVADVTIAIGASDAQTGQVDPFLPFREVLLRLIKGGDSAPSAVWNPAACRAVLEQGPDLVNNFIPSADTPALITHAQAAGWAGELPSPQQPSLGQQAVDQSKILEQYAAFLSAITAQTPLIVILEDLHWADTASLGLLFRLGRQLDNNRLLILGTYRSEQAHLAGQEAENVLEGMLHELQRHQGSITIDLEAVRKAEGREFVDGLLDTEPNRLNESFRQALYQHTGGHPLFVVELLDDLKETAALVRDSTGRWVVGEALDWRSLPARVEGAIAGRIDHLTAEQRWLLTIASVSGERFLAEVVAHVAGIEPRQLVDMLSRDLQTQHHLLEAEGVERLGEGRLTRYRFRHNLIQVYLYGQLDEVQRTYLHEDVANALEVLYGEEVGQIALPLARHYQAAGVTPKAIAYLIQAGKQAARLTAYDEAVQHFGQADSLLATLPENPTTQQQAFVIQFNLGQALSDNKGPGSEESGKAFTRALALGRHLGDKHQLAQVLFRLSYHMMYQGKADLAQAYGEECLRLAEDNQDPELSLAALKALQFIALALGQPAVAVAHSRQVIAFYHTHRPNLTSDDAFDLALTMASSLALSLVPLGYPDEALRQAQEALALVERYEHPQGIASCLGLVSAIHFMRGAWAAALKFGQAQRAVSTTHNLNFVRTFGEMHEGTALAILGEVDAGLALTRQAITERRGLGISHSHAYSFTQLAKACGRAGRATEGLSLINEALLEIDSNNDRQFESYTYQVKGDLLLLQALADEQWAIAQQEAETCLHRAIEIAQNRQAKLREARALASLCRLLHSQGRDEGCRQQLADLYAWFTEGFETEDLQVVKTVLEEIG